jgi:hypothetical protein
VCRVAAPPGGRELSPGNLRKEGPDLDLPVAMGDPNHFQRTNRSSRGGTAFIEATRAPDYESFPGSSSRSEKSMESPGSSASSISGGRGAG